MHTSTRSTEVPQAGYSIPAFCKAISISRATFYNLLGDLRPRSVRLNKRLVIIESPQDYLNRLAAAQQGG